MCFDDPIILDQESFDNLMTDTEQRRICWMYHDILSDRKVARMFDRYARKGTPVGEAWTAMAWVAAGRQENSFYLLYKWYDDFYGPPKWGDLYYIQRDGGLDDGVLVRHLNMDFLVQLGSRGQSWRESLWNRVSENATDFFGENEFETRALRQILRWLDENPGEELETFDWYLGPRNDGEKAAQCATIAAYFLSIQSMEEIVYNIVVTDGGESAVHHMHTHDFLEILKRMNSAVDARRLPELGSVFQELADGFCPEPVRTPELPRSAGRAMLAMTQNGQLTWLRLGGQGKRKLLRELYSRYAPRYVWDMFHHCQAQVYFTFIHRPPVRGLHRGVYLISRFEDQRGMDVTQLFWLENINCGVVHLCDGDFFEELADMLLARPAREVVMHGGRRRADDLAAAYAGLLKEAYEKVERGITQHRGTESDAESIY